MSATITGQDPASDAPQSPRDAARGPVSDDPDGPALQDRMPQWFRSPRSLPLYVLAIGLAFCYFSYRPLWHEDLWGHLSYGRLIVSTGGIPEFEPFMPLAEGVPLVDTAWLSQVLGYRVQELFGVTALQFLYAGAIALCLSLLAWRFHQRTGSVAFSLAGLLLFLWVGSHVLAVIRPQLAGLCCFVGLFVLLNSRRPHAADWFVVPVLFALWANLHGSFPVGLLLLATFCAGRAIDVWRRTGRFSRVWKDRRTRRLLLLTELAAAAVLLNPYGLQLYAEVFAVASNPNLQDLKDWEPLTLRMQQGRAALAVAFALMVLIRFSPRRVRATEALLLIGLGAAALWSSRFLVWWAPLAAFSFVQHGHAVVRKISFRPFAKLSRPRPAGCDPSAYRRSLWTVAAIGLAWICFACTPFGFRLVHGEGPELAESVSEETPLGTAAYLREHPPRGQIFNAFEQGDYLVWAGPPGLPVFVTSHAHLVPAQVWYDYVSVLLTEDGWESVLERYGVNTVVWPHRHERLMSRLRASDEWELQYEDSNSAVFVRKTPLPGTEARPQ